MKTIRLQTPKDTFTVDYPEAAEFALKQSKAFWHSEEVKVHKDKQDILVNMTEAERHGTITVLRLFTKYEQIIGDEFWLNFVFKKYPRPADIQPMAAFFGAMELQVHSKFYSKINEVLGLATDEFYTAYVDDPVLKERIDFLQDTLSNKDDLRALGGFAFGEGAILYTSFAYLKHFQSQGKNKALNIVSGINYSARDENLHMEAAAWLFRTHLQEMREAGLIDAQYEADLKADIIKSAYIVEQHEAAISKKIFEKGPIPGVTEIQLNNFGKSRINLVCRELGYENLFKIDYNPIAEWFYDGINGYSVGDFFSSQNNTYERSWDENSFVW